MKWLSVIGFSVSMVFSVTSFTLGATEEDIVFDKDTAGFHTVEQNNRAIAKSIALEYTDVEQNLRSQITDYNLSLSFSELEGISKEAQSRFFLHSHHILQLKGMEQRPKELDLTLIQLRLADVSMVKQLQMGEVPLFTYGSQNDDEGVIEAFDTDGNIEYLDAFQLPSQPVFIVELNKTKTMAHAVKAMNDVFDRFQEKATPTLAFDSLSEGLEPLSMTVIKNIELKTIKESWLSGPAEVYAIITGVNAVNDELTPQIEVVELPYLDKAKKAYSPNQIIVQWERYKWQAVDIVLMESDDNINYKTLAMSMLQIATQILQLIPDTGTQSAAIVTEMTNAIIHALPDSWMTNDDDYLDVFYTILENQAYSEYKGANQNAKITLEPLMIQPR